MTDPINELVIAIVRRMSELPELKDLPNAERSYLAGDIYNMVAAELRKERERVMDEFGILHGEAAKKLHEYMGYNSNYQRLKPLVVDNVPIMSGEVAQKIEPLCKPREGD